MQAQSPDIAETQKRLYGNKRMPPAQPPALPIRDNLPKDRKNVKSMPSRTSFADLNHHEVDDFQRLSLGSQIQSHSTLGPQTSSSASNAKDLIKKELKNQKFWKYHILKSNKNEFYLTTNPDNRHKIVRNAPGYYVTLQFPKTKTDPFASAANNGFRLCFKKQTYPTLDAETDSLNFEEEDESKASFIVEKQPFNIGGAYVIKIHQNCFVSKYLTVCSSSAKNELETVFKNNSNSETKNSLIMESCYVKGKVRVCSLKEKNSTLFKNKIDGIKLSKEGSIYYFDDNFQSINWYDAAIGLFRPCERGVVTKITKKVLSKKVSVQRENDYSSNNHNDDYGLDLDDYEDNENTYYLSRDGLIQRHPQDDSPNDFKLGWITIYNKYNYFNEANGNWERVLGLTFAAGFGTLIDKYIKEIDY